MIALNVSTLFSQSLSLRILSIETLRMTECFSADSLWLKRVTRREHARFRFYYTYDTYRTLVSYASLRLMRKRKQGLALRNMEKLLPQLLKVSFLHLTFPAV